MKKVKNIDKDKFQQWQYENSANDPNTWLRHARALKKSADLVYIQVVVEENNFENTDFIVSPSSLLLWPVYLMLSGLAIENLIKGNYIVVNGAISDNGNLLKVLTHHDKHKERLLDCCKILSLDNSDYELIGRLEQYVLSWGRYGIEKCSKRKFPNGVDEKDPRIPMTGVLKHNAEDILRRNEKGDFSALPTISNYFCFDIDKIQIDSTYQKLEEVIRPYCEKYKPDFKDLGNS